MTKTDEARRAGEFGDQQRDGQGTNAITSTETGADTASQSTTDALRLIARQLSLIARSLYVIQGELVTERGEHLADLLVTEFNGHRFSVADSVVELF